MKRPGGKHCTCPSSRQVVGSAGEVDSSPLLLLGCRILSLFSHRPVTAQAGHVACIEPCKNRSLLHAVSVSCTIYGKTNRVLDRETISLQPSGSPASGCDIPIFRALVCSEASGHAEGKSLP